MKKLLPSRCCDSDVLHNLIVLSVDAQPELVLELRGCVCFSVVEGTVELDVEFLCFGFGVGDKTALGSEEYIMMASVAV